MSVCFLPVKNVIPSNEHFHDKHDLRKPVKLQHQRRRRGWITEGAEQRHNAGFHDPVAVPHFEAHRHKEGKGRDPDLKNGRDLWRQDVPARRRLMGRHVRRGGDQVTVHERAVLVELNVHL